MKATKPLTYRQARTMWRLGNINPKYRTEVYAILFGTVPAPLKGR